MQIGATAGGGGGQVGATAGGGEYILVTCVVYIGSEGGEGRSKQALG